MRTPLIFALTLTTLAVPALAQEAATGPAPPAAKIAAPPEDLAREAASTAVQACRRMGYKTMATVVDTTGRPVAAMTADPELTPVLAQGSVRNAAVAAEFHTASSGIAERVHSDTAVFYTVHNDPRLTDPKPGGVPLTGPEKPKGAIGVAGAPDAVKDEACAQAGAARIASRLK